MKTLFLSILVLAILFGCGKKENVSSKPKIKITVNTLSTELVLVRFKSEKVKSFDKALTVFNENEGYAIFKPKKAGKLVFLIMRADGKIFFEQKVKVKIKNDPYKFSIGAMDLSPGTYAFAIMSQNNDEIIAKFFKIKEQKNPDNSNWRKDEEFHN